MIYWLPYGRKGRRIFHTRGVVRWKRTAGGPKTPSGVAVELPPAEASTRRMLLDYAQGGKPAAAYRRFRRFPAMIPVQRSAKNGFSLHLTYDIGQEGAFILTEDDTWEVGAWEELTLLPPEPFVPFQVLAHVRWQRSVEPAGIGVQFHLATDRSLQHVQNLLQHIKQVITDFHQNRSRNSLPKHYKFIAS